MRITYLSTISGYYGGEVHLASLAAGMAHRGHEITCVACPGSQLSLRLSKLDLRLETLPLSHWYEPFSVGRLGQLLRETGTQILHTHVPRDYYTAAATTIGTSVVNVGTRHQLFPIGLPVLKRPFLARFQTMIAVSEAVRGSLLEARIMDPDRIVTIPNGIAAVCPKVVDSPQQGPLRLACGVAANDPLIGFVGRLCPTKGLETLILAVSRLVQRWPRLKLCVIGEEDGRKGYLNQLEGLVQRHGLGQSIHFLGYREDAAWAAREFNVQVVCSLAEPFGLVTLEAMAQGRPVVVTNTGGSPEIVDDGVEGFLVRPGDVSQLAGRLDVLLDSTGLCREMGRRGRHRLERDFTLELMLDRIEKIYRQALNLPVLKVGEASA